MDGTIHLTTISKKKFTTDQSGLSNRNNQQRSTEFVDIVKYVQLTILEDTVCNTSINPTNEVIFDEVSMFCSDASTGKGHCAGDQGGPLVCKDNANDNANDKAIVAGVISWSEDCGTKPGVYSRVTHVLDWIQDYLVILPFYGVGPFVVKPSLIFRLSKVSAKVR